MSERVADVLWSMLVGAGVKRCYGIVGDALNPEVDGLRRNGQVEFIHVRDEEPGAFEELVENYQNRLIGVMHHLVGNLSEAEDLAQEAFLRVYRARKKYRARSKFSTWLFTIANNLALNSLRSRQRRPGMISE